jgi:tetratricopeptide (TPR) repeat protein
VQIATPSPAQFASAEEAEEEVRRLRRFALGEPERQGRALGLALIGLANRLVDDGRIAKARAAADEAVDLIEGLRDRFGASYNDAYGFAVHALARCHDGDEAVTLYAESVEVLRKTREFDPSVRAQRRAPVLVDYAASLLSRERAGEAEAPAQEAIALCREVSQVAPELRPTWARALRILAIARRGLGRPDEALDAARRATNIARDLARRDPTHQDELALSLAQVALAQHDAQADDSGLACAEEAEALARDVGNDRLLATVLGHIWRCFESAGQTGRALNATEEAARLATSDSAALRRALEEHATMLDVAGRAEEAQAARDRAAATD